MKRAAALLVILVILSSVCTVYAEEELTDTSYGSLQDMTVEELVELGGQIGVELQGRGLFTQDEIPEGTYVVGIDIKAGNYEFTAYTSGTNAFGAAVDGDIRYYTYDGESGSYSKDFQHEFCERDYGTPFYMTLTEGDKIEITYATLYVKAVEAKSWQP